jgi:hypothetical protein
MQFRSPFGQPPSEQSWQPQRELSQYPAQNQLYPQQQWQQQPFLPQYQPPPEIQPQPPKKKSHIRLWLIIFSLVVVLSLAFAIGYHGTNVSTTESSRTTVAPAQIPTQTQQSTSQSTPVTTITTSTAANLQNIKPTHGTPTIAGQISDFFGTYGKPLTTNGRDTVWLLSSDGSLSLDARDTGRGAVGYLAVSAPPSWSKQKLQAFCLGFAPDNDILDKASMPNNTNGLYIYDSPSSKFALHVSSGTPNYCYMNTLV